MRKRDEIRTLFNNFAEYLEKYDLDSLKSLFTDNVCGHISTVGEVKGADQVASALVVNKDDLTLRRHLISNFVVHTKGDSARQSSYMMSLVGKDDGKFLHSFEYGGKFLINWNKNDSNWKIDEIWFDLDWVKGNTSFVPEWTLLDYQIYSGHKPMIYSEFDSPWAFIPENDETLTDEEQIIENMFRYSFGLDNCDWTLHLGSYTNDVKFVAGGKVLADCAGRLVDNFKNTSHKEAALEHAIKIVGVEVNGDKAVMYGSRIEPHRLCSKILCRNTLNNNFYTAKYVNYLKKIDGVWKMYELNYTAKVFFDTYERNSHYFDDFEGDK